jgi:hypothetical protein
MEIVNYAKVSLLFITITINAAIVENAYLTTYYNNFNQQGFFEDENKLLNIDNEAKKIIIGLNGTLIDLDYQLKYTNYQTSIDKEDELVIKQLDYIYDINDEFSLQIGKFIENWQLGFAFNPLGVTDPYQQPDINNIADTKLGINALVLRYDNDNTHIDVYTNNDNKEDNAIYGYGYSAKAFRVNQNLNENYDLTIILHQKDNYSLGAGMGIRGIINNNLQLYSSYFSRKGTTLATHKALLNNDSNAIYFTNPVSDYRKNDNKQYPRILLGAQYTTNNNLGIILEFSYDKRGMNDKEWDSYKNLVKNHNDSQSLVSDLNLAWDLSIITPKGLRQYYVFINFNKTLDKHKINFSNRISSDYSILHNFGWHYDINDNALINIAYSITSGEEDSEYKNYFLEQDKLAFVFSYSF